MNRIETQTWSLGGRWLRGLAVAAMLAAACGGGGDGAPDAAGRDGGAADTGASDTGTPTLDAGRDGAAGADDAAGPSVVWAFPTALGFGASATGGRGGTPCFVTNTNGSGAGSLRACFDNALGTRTILFTVSGTIDLEETPLVLQEEHDGVTLACQTSPGGIQIHNGAVSFYRSGNVIMRHCKIRIGLQGEPGTDPDTNFVVWGVDGTTPSSDIIVDHSEFAWANDENMSGWNGADNVTFQYNVVHEPSLLWSTQQTERHNLNSLFGADYCDPPTGFPVQHVTYARNIIANSGGRNPRVSATPYAPGDDSSYTPCHPTDYATDVELVNNVIYNWQGSNGTNFSSEFFSTTAWNRWRDQGYGSALRVNVIGNYWAEGPNSNTSAHEFLFINHFISMHMRDNQSNYWNAGAPFDGFLGVAFWNVGVADSALPDHGTWYYWGGWDPDAVPGSGHDAQVDDAFDFGTNTVALASSEVKAHLLGNAGPIVPIVDAMTQRLRDDVGGETSGNVGTVTFVLPSQGAAGAPADADSDGMPDSWETTCGLDPESGVDGPRLAVNGYSNLENYLNDLAGDTNPGGRCGGGPAE